MEVLLKYVLQTGEPIFLHCQAGWSFQPFKVVQQLPTHKVALQLQNSQQNLQT